MRAEGMPLMQIKEDVSGFGGGGIWNGSAVAWALFYNGSKLWLID